MGLGIRCLDCGGDTKTVDTRGMQGYRIRRRECIDCGERQTTYEKPAGVLIRDQILIAKIRVMQKRIRDLERELSELHSLCAEVNI